MSDTFRKNFAPLSDQQKAEMQAIKEKAEELEELFNKSVQREPRLMAVAKTNLETSVMWAVKAVTTEEKVGKTHKLSYSRLGMGKPQYPSKIRGFVSNFISRVE